MRRGWISRPGFAVQHRTCCRLEEEGEASDSDVDVEDTPQKKLAEATARAEKKAEEEKQRKKKEEEDKEPGGMSGERRSIIPWQRQQQQQ